MNCFALHEEKEERKGKSLLKTQRKKEEGIELLLKSRAWEGKRKKKKEEKGKMSHADPDDVWKETFLLSPTPPHTRKRICISSRARNKKEKIKQNLKSDSRI